MFFKVAVEAQAYEVFVKGGVISASSPRPFESRDFLFEFLKKIQLRKNLFLSPKFSNNFDVFLRFLGCNFCLNNTSKNP